MDILDLSALCVVRVTLYLLYNCVAKGYLLYECAVKRHLLYKCVYGYLLYACVL